MAIDQVPPAAGLSHGEWGNMSGDGSGGRGTVAVRVFLDWSTVDGATRMRTPRAIAVAVVFVGFGAAAHRLGVGTPVHAIPKVVIAALVAPMVWLLLPATVSVARALLAACGAQVVLHLALLGMEPSSGGSASSAHRHQGPPAVASDSIGHVGGSASSVSLVQAHVAAALLTGVILLVAADVLRAVLRSGDAAPSGSAEQIGAGGDRQPHVTAHPPRVRSGETSFVVHHSLGGPSPSGHLAAGKSPAHVRMPPLPR